MTLLKREKYNFVIHKIAQTHVKIDSRRALVELSQKLRNVILKLDFFMLLSLSRNKICLHKRENKRNTHLVL